MATKKETLDHTPLIPGAQYRQKLPTGKWSYATLITMEGEEPKRYGYLYRHGFLPETIHEGTDEMNGWELFSIPQLVPAKTVKAVRGKRAAAK